VSARAGLIDLPNNARMRLASEEMGAVIAQEIDQAMQLVDATQRQKVARQLLQKLATVTAQLVTLEAMERLEKKHPQVALLMGPMDGRLGPV
jgi:hypothetical protein